MGFTPPHRYGGELFCNARIFFRCEATDMVSERNEGNEEGNGYMVGKPPRGTKGGGIVVRMWIKPALLHML